MAEHRKATDPPGQRSGGRRRRLRLRRRAALVGLIVAVLVLAVPIHRLILSSQSRGPQPGDPRTLATNAAVPALEGAGVAAADSLGASSGTGPIVGTASSNVMVRVNWTVDGGGVPVDAPLSTFPVSSAVDPAEFGCTAEQVAWLGEHGVARPPRGGLDGRTLLLVNETLQNMATSGNPISVRNIRVDGAFADATAPRFEVACVSQGIGEVSPPIFALATVGDSTPAVFAENTDPDGFYTEDQLVRPDLIGTPVVLNLLPGEEVSMLLFLDSVDPGRDFVGRIVSDVVNGAETYPYVLKEGFIQAAEPAVEHLHVLVGFGSLFCLPDSESFERLHYPSAVEDLMPFLCTPDDLAALAKASS